MPPCTDGLGATQTKLDRHPRPHKWRKFRVTRLGDAVLCTRGNSGDQPAAAALWLRRKIILL